MKPVVEFLEDHTLALQATPPNPELLALAKQMQAILACFEPDDPMVVELKASPAYQQVVYLLEK